MQVEQWFTASAALRAQGRAGFLWPWQCMAAWALGCGTPVLCGDPGALSDGAADAAKTVQRVGRVKACQLVLVTPFLIAC